MILSHEHRFIFIGTFETGAAHIERRLAPYCGPHDVIAPVSDASTDGSLARNWRIEHPQVPRLPFWKRLRFRAIRQNHPSVGFYDHMPAWRVRAYVGEDVWSSYFKFAFERNPWDRQVAWFLTRTTGRARPRWWSFDEALRDRRRAYIPNFDLYTEGGTVALDHVGRYEALETELDAIVATLGVGGSSKLPIGNPAAIAADYRAYYTPQTRDLIAQWYPREIGLLSYGF